MKSPAQQKIIQIDITNSCVHRCSNCTRFCGHHRKPFMMKPDFFEIAVNSLDGYSGMVGVMGGEPTLHPEFERIARYVQEHVSPCRPSTKGRYPIRDFAEYRNLEIGDVNAKRGLWTSLGKAYYKHFEIIQDTFEYQCVNDHSNPGLHQALLMTRKELGIADDKWIQLRDNCWIQNLWSSAITPKGAFFCEVAAALDMLFDGPGGWPVEKGWWQRTPADFKDQLHWCELCSAALNAPRRPARDEIDDTSPGMLKKLEAAGSPKLKQGKVNVIRMDGDADSDEARPTYEWYLPQGDNSQRISDTNTSLHTGTVQVIQIRDTVSPSILFNNQHSGWLAFVETPHRISNDFLLTIAQWILNPGCAYFITERNIAPVQKGPLNILQDAGSSPSKHNIAGVLIHTHAASLQSWLSKDTTSNFTLTQLISIWPADKRIDLVSFFGSIYPIDIKTNEAVNLARRTLATMKGLQSKADSLALFGAGQHTQWLVSIIEAANLVRPAYILDDQPFLDTIGSIKVIRADNAPKDLQYIVVSADPGPVTEKILLRCKDLFPNSSIINLYPDQKPGRLMRPSPTECLSGT